MENLMVSFSLQLNDHPRCSCSRSRIDRLSSLFSSPSPSHLLLRPAPANQDFRCHPANSVVIGTGRRTFPACDWVHFVSCWSPRPKFPSGILAAAHNTSHTHLGRHHTPTIQTSHSCLPVLSSLVRCNINTQNCLSPSVTKSPLLQLYFFPNLQLGQFLHCLRLQC